MIVDEVLFTVPPWNRGAKLNVKRRGGSGVSRKLGEDHDGPDFDAAETSGRDTGCNRGCFVHACRFDQVVAAKQLLGLCEGTIGGERLAVADTNGFRRRRGLQRVPTFDGACML